MPTFDNAELVIGGPLTYDEEKRQFTAESHDITLVSQILPFSVEAEFAEYPKADYPTVSTAKAAADVEFDNPCLDPFEFESTDQVDPTQTVYSDTPIVFSLNRFTIDPPRCKIAYVCTSVVRSDGAASDIGCSDFTETGLFFDETKTEGTLSLQATESDYKNLVYAPGVYIVTITGTASRSENAAKKTRTTTFEVTLEDPCDAPASLIKPAFENQEYTITDDSFAPYTHPEFTVSPAYCPIKYEYNWTKLSNDDSAITQDSANEKKFSFFYDQSLEPLSESQTVTVTVVTDSLYPTPTTEKLTET